MIIKKKLRLRDLTVDKYKKCKEQICRNYRSCYGCPFSSINCGTYDSLSWIYNKDLYSDKFLDQEIEFEVSDILTKEEKEYLEVVLKSLYNSGIVIKCLVKCESSIEGFERLNCMNNGYCYNTLTFKKGTMFKNMELDTQYTPEDVDLNN